MKKELSGKTLTDEKLKLIHLLEIKMDFRSNLIKDVTAVTKIQGFLQKNQTLHEQKIGQLYYLSGLTLYENKAEGSGQEKKILELI